MTPNLLLVEDDSALGQTLFERLTKEKYQVTLASTLASAKQAFLTQAFDLIILDVGLPDGSGFDFAKEILKSSPIPFLFVTANAGAPERLKGFELGAEEFIPKPFHLKELLIRVKHVLQNHAVTKLVELESCTVDLVKLEIRSKDGSSERLTAKEGQLLKLLLQNSHRPVSRDEILEKIWGEDNFPTNRTIDNVIVRIRQLLGDESGKIIHSVRGVGYQWASEE